MSGSSSGSYVTLDALEPEGGSIAEWSATDPSSARMTPLDPSAPEQGLDGEPLAHDVLVLGVRAHDVTGAVLDRGFCTPAVVRTLRELHVDFVAMMPHDAVGYKEALAGHGDEPGWGTERLVSDDGTFGATVEGRIWGRHDDRAHINLYFSGTSASAQSVALIRRVTEAMAKARAALAQGRQPAIGKSLKAYLKLCTGGGRVTSVEYDHEAWDRALREKGFFVIMTSRDMGAREALEAYGLRDPSEKEFMILKSQEGHGATRTRPAASIRSKLATGFLRGLLRFEVRASCARLGLDTNRMIRKVDGIRLLRSVTGIYTPVRKCTGDQLALLGDLGVEAGDFVAIAQDYNQRLLNPTDNKVHALSEHAPRPRRGRGRPKGSKDSKPRKRRSDAGIKRGPRNKAAVQ